MREGGLSGIFLTGVPGTLLESFRDEWKGDHGVPRLGEAAGLSLRASVFSAMEVEGHAGKKGGRG